MESRPVTESEKTKRPASQYYWGDWFKDVALQSCSLPARGLWHEMNCLMHQGEPYGHLTLPNGKAMGTGQLANLCKISPALCKKLVQELEDNGVSSRTAEGVIYSRRMVRDEAVRQARAEGGKAGAEHGIKGAESGKKGGRPRQVEGGSETPLPGFDKPPPSSSSSSSPSGEKGANAPSSTPVALLPACPHREILRLFAEKLPSLSQPRPEMWEDSKSAAALRERWKWLLTKERASDGTRYATNTQEGLDWFGRFFDYVAGSDFLMGRRTGSEFKCTLQWLVNKENFFKVVQGNYDAAQPQRRVA